jgi:hypothetical protein
VFTVRINKSEIQSMKFRGSPYSDEASGQLVTYDAGLLVMAAPVEPITGMGNRHKKNTSKEGG